MSCDCCPSSEKAPQKLACPACGNAGDTVHTATLLHQLVRPWQHTIDDQQYYFCRHPGCEVAYFGSRGARFNIDTLRRLPGHKSTNNDRMLCYCFDIRFNDISDSAAEKQCRDFVSEKTRSKLCRCETHNPSGRCCLRDFPKHEE